MLYYDTPNKLMIYFHQEVDLNESKKKFLTQHLSNRKKKPIAPEYDSVIAITESGVIDGD